MKKETAPESKEIATTFLTTTVNRSLSPSKLLQVSGLLKTSGEQNPVSLQSLPWLQPHKLVRNVTVGLFLLPRTAWGPSSDDITTVALLKEYATRKLRPADPYIAISLAYRGGGKELLPQPFICPWQAKGEWHYFCIYMRYLWVTPVLLADFRPSKGKWPVGHYYIGTKVD